MRTFVAAISLALTLPELAGCGQLGPLYMPEEEPPPATASAPAAAAAQAENAPQSTSAP